MSPEPDFKDNILFEELALYLKLGGVLPVSSANYTLKFKITFPYHLLCLIFKLHFCGIFVVRRFLFFPPPALYNRAPASVIYC